jgi:hypothetical protein
MKTLTLFAILCCLLFSQPVPAQTKYATPQAAAKALYAAWKTKNKGKAKLAAENKAIDKLFEANFQPKWKFAGCNDESESEKGLFQCIYKDATDDLLSVAFDTVKTKRGWRVRWLTFGAEE